jgi:hypothetical protein
MYPFSSPRITIKRKLSLTLSAALLACCGAASLNAQVSTVINQLSSVAINTTARPKPTILPPDFTPPGHGNDYKKMWETVLAEIAVLEKTLVDKNATIVNLDKQILGQTAELASRKKSLVDVGKRLAECLAECESLKLSLKSKQAELKARKESVGQLTAKLEKSQDGIEVLEGEIAQLNEDLAEAERKMLVPHTPGWHFIDGKGWLWTHPDYYPLIYSEQNAGWLYYELGTQGPWLYYDYNSEVWQEWFAN